MHERIGLLTGQATEVALTGAAFSNGVNATSMARICNKHKQINPHTNRTQLEFHAKRNARFGVGVNTPFKRKVFVAMSGGVDSSVSAALLKEGDFSARGGLFSDWDVRGVHIKMWSDPDIPCNFKEDRYDAMRVAAKLDIPFETWDFTKEYKQTVVEYMIREYAAGRTPNPDVMCNRRIKFGVFLKRALKEGADYIATGHYVCLMRNFQFPRRRQSGYSASATISNFQTNSKFKIQNNENLEIENCKLKIAKDGNKDQSYFLWTLTQEQLRHCIFPVGEYTKPEVRALARKFGLPTAEKPDSQGICFIGEINVRDFLKNYIPVERGRVLTTSGKVIGEHEGLSFYTIGQRHGLSIGGRPREAGESRSKGAGGIPYYVAGKDSDTNTLLVAEGPYDKKLFSSELAVTDINWISGKEPKFPMQCEARIRYRQPLQSCWVEQIYTNDQRISANHESSGLLVIRKNSSNNSRSIRVRFEEPQRAVTPGQSIVFYKKRFLSGAQGREMLGGGIIC